MAEALATRPRVDVLAIARRALAPVGETPDEVIERELSAALGESWHDSHRYRRLWQSCADARSELLGRTPAGPEALTARVLWDAYDRGLSQRMLAKRLGLLQAYVSDRSVELGFVLIRDQEDGRRWRVVEGPCASCLVPFPSARLDEAHYCPACQEGR